MDEGPELSNKSRPKDKKAEALVMTRAEVDENLDASLGNMSRQALEWKKN